MPPGTAMDCPALPRLRVGPDPEAQLARWEPLHVGLRVLAGGWLSLSTATPPSTLLSTALAILLLIFYTVAWMPSFLGFAKTACALRSARSTVNGYSNPVSPKQHCIAMQGSTLRAPSARGALTVRRPTRRQGS